MTELITVAAYRSGARVCLGVLLGAFLPLHVGAGGRADAPAAVRLSRAEWAKVRTLSPLPPVPPDTTNKYADNPAAAALGKKIYSDKRFSGPITYGEHKGKGGMVSCASCHAAPWGDHGRRVSAGTIWGGRNTAPIGNVQFYDWYFWAGRADSLWQANIGAAASIMDANRLRVAHVLYDHYRDEYNAIFDDALPEALAADHPQAARFPPSGEPGRRAMADRGEATVAVAASTGWDSMTPADQEAVHRIAANYGKALAAYMRLLVSRDAPLDRYVAGDRAAISTSAQRGLKLFIGKARCIECHSGPAFTDNKFHNIGLRQEGSIIRQEDYGRYEEVPIVLGNMFNSDGRFSDDRNTRRLAGLTNSAENEGRFRTKHLRQIAETAPYMHTGSHKTLRDVMQFYNRGGDDSGFPGTKDPLMKPLGLTEAEMDDVVEFLKSLTGQPIPASLLAPAEDAYTSQNWSD